MAKLIGIYLITHRESGRRYVGQSINIAARRSDHARGRSGSGILHRAISKYGWHAFDFEVLELCREAQLNAAEIGWIAKMKTLAPAGFNLTTGGQIYRFTDAARKIISERTRAVMTPEWIAARAKAQRGIPKSDTWKASMSNRQKQPDNVARIAALARNQSVQTREKIAAAHRGRKASPETRAKISAAKTGVKQGPRSPELQARMSLAMRAGWARRRERLAKEVS